MSLCFGWSWLVRFTVGHAKRSTPRPRWGGPHARRGGLLLGVDGYQLTAGPLLEGDDAVRRGEEGVIPTLTDVPARVDFGAPLADDDSTSLNLLATETLHAETLCIAIPTVPTGAYAFFMCHRYPQSTVRPLAGGD